MSRTYRKFVKCGICNGSNTEFYRGRNRKSRRVNRSNLHSLITNHTADEVDELVSVTKLPHDSWNEPTDGTFLVSKKDKDFYINDSKHSRFDEDYWNRKFGRYLKPKHHE